MRINGYSGERRPSARFRTASALLAMLTVGGVLAGCATAISGIAERAAASAASSSAANSGAPSSGAVPGSVTAPGSVTTPNGSAAPSSSAAISSAAPSSDAASASSAAPGSSAASPSSAAPGSSAGPGLSTAAPTASTDHLARSSVATVDGQGTITLALPDAPHAIVIDVYEDALCPFCGRFEQQYGQQIRQAIEQGKLTVRYRMVTFLDSKSASGSYSTRAFAAMLAVATDAGDRPGLFASFHEMLFDPAVQPQEDGPDLADSQLADLARQAGAPATAVSDIAGGRFHQPASAAATANLALLTHDSPEPGTPTVIHDHTVVTISDPSWLATLLGG